MKEYIVTQNILDLRSSATDETDDNFIGQLTVGETLYLTDEEIIGTIPNGGTTNIWKSDNFNRLVSADGVRLKNYADKKAEFIADPFNQSFIDPTDPANEAKWKVNWGIVDLEIWKIWRDYDTKGEGVKVAIIDTGVQCLNNDLNTKINKSVSFATNSDGSIDNNDDDLNPYHGTKSAGIIGANGLFAKTVIGVAPNCSINVYKATNGLFDFGSVILSIQEAIKDGMKIISMSFTCQDDITLAEWINYAKSQDVILIAAAGDAGSNQKCYPASYPGCLSIGAYFLDGTDNRGIYKTNSNYNDAVTFVAPGKDVLTTSIGTQPTYHQETSAATAFVAGLFALLISKVPTFNYDQLTDLISLHSITETIEISSGRSDYEGYGILNLRSVLEILNIN